MLAVVEPQLGTEPSDELARELTEHCRARLASFKCPRRIDFTDQLPRHENGKLYKERLRAVYRAARKRSQAMSAICDGRVAIVTGAGRGIGRGHALELARQGARVVVNDLGGAIDGSGADTGPAQVVVDEIRAAGGDAIANARRRLELGRRGGLDQPAIETFGRPRHRREQRRHPPRPHAREHDRRGMGRGHPRPLEGHVRPTHFAAAYWRERSKAGRPVDARVINTSSTSGLFANPGQTNYGAAKSGIATFSIIAAKELGRYGVTVNAIAPGVLTRMTENLSADTRDTGARDGTSATPENIAPARHLAGEPGVRGHHRPGVPRGRRAHRRRERMGPGPGRRRRRRWDPASSATSCRGSSRMRKLTGALPSAP